MIIAHLTHVLMGLVEQPMKHMSANVSKDLKEKHVMKLFLNVRLILVQMAIVLRL